jgi:hypothetical protein
LPNFTETRSCRRSAAAIYSNSPHGTSMGRLFTASAIRHRFSTKFSRDRSGTAALTWITPTILATTGPAAQQVPRRSAILIESAMVHPGIPRTPRRDAVRRRSKAAAARAFSIVSHLTDIHRLNDRIGMEPALRTVFSGRLGDHPGPTLFGSFFSRRSREDASTIRERHFLCIRQIGLVSG